jgi:D-3-phosphoglycerate dehydrogenase / 2-oxoglutarate reductase
MKVLVVDKMHDVLVNDFISSGWQVDVDLTSPKEDVENKIANYQGLIIRSRFPVDKRFIDRATRLKFIGRPGAGLENIDTDYCETKSITCFRSPEGNCDALGEHTIGMLLALLNNFRKADREVREGLWNRKQNTGIELGGKTVAIIGFGYMGTAFAQRLKSFNVNLLVYDKYKKGYGNDYVNESSMNEIYESADIVSIHTPLTSETRGFINRDFFNAFKKPIIIINTARGPILKIKDLADSMQSGKVSGACLDVLEYENQAFGFSPDINSAEWQYLINSDSVIFTPHVAGITFEGEYKMAKELASKILTRFQ